MTLVVLKKEMKEYCKSPANIIFSIIMIAIEGVILPIFSGSMYQTLLIALSSIPVILLGPKAFAGEKEEKTFESTLNLPIDIKSIFRAKTLNIFTICVFMLYISYIIGVIVSFMVNGGTNLYLNVYSLICIFILIPLLLLNFCKLSIYFSVKSKDLASVQGIMMVAMMVYSIISTIPTITIMIQDINIIVIIIVYAIYFAINIIIYVIISLVSRKYLDKSFLFTNLRN